MKINVVFLLLYLIASRFLLANDEIVQFSADDTVFLLVEDNRVDVIKINVKVLNASDSIITINQLVGVDENGSIHGGYISDYCAPNYYGRYKKLMLKNNDEPYYHNPQLSVGDFIYFNTRGELKKVFLEGVLKQGKVRRQLRKRRKRSMRPQKITLSPSEEVKFEVAVYVGDYIFEKGGRYYLCLVYNSYGQKGLSDTCFKSNKILLIVE